MRIIRISSENLRKRRCEMFGDGRGRFSADRVRLASSDARIERALVLLRSKPIQIGELVCLVRFGRDCHI
jgi:hypothetical protein